MQNYSKKMGCKRKNEKKCKKNATFVPWNQNKKQNKLIGYDPKKKRIPYIREYYNYGCGSRGQSPGPGGRHGGFRSLCRSRRCGRLENPEEKTSLLRSDSREVPPIFSLSARISEFAAVASGNVSHTKSSSNTSNSKFWTTLHVSARWNSTAYSRYWVPWKRKNTETSWNSVFQTRDGLHRKKSHPETHIRRTEP